jgi:Tfp pilus assembly pilus retraction ATPase PilT
VPKLPWDRLLETYVRRGASAVIMPVNCAPMAELEGYLRAFQVEPLTSNDLKAIADEILAQYAKEGDGFRYVDFHYHSAPNPDWLFRLHVFGDPSPTLLVLTKLPDDHPGQIDQTVKAE